MSKTDIIYIILIAVFALGIAVFQYFYKAKRADNKRFLFALLRFMSLFLLGVLLLNPTFKQKVITNIKPKLIVAVDNSNSIHLLKHDQKVNEFLNELKETQLSEKFQIDYYSFGDRVQLLTDSVHFDEQQTNIGAVFSSMKDIYSDNQAPTILLTDGNQTYGQDFVTASLTYKQPVYPIVLGGSVLKSDIKIKNIHHNKYAFLNNEFQVEVSVSYIGEVDISKKLIVYSGESKVYVKSLGFSKENNTQVVPFTLPASYVGKHKYKVVIETIVGEENTFNNIRNFSVDVIDERTNVLVISDIIHPDLGALKKAIETNQQRKVTIAKSGDIIDYNKYQLLILYQPTSKFKDTYKQIEVFKKNYLTITGLQTDWSFLNSASNNYKNKVINQSQAYLGRYNPKFYLFQNEELNITSFPPLLGFYGDVQLENKAEVFLYQTINSVNTEVPLFAFFETNGRREGALFGEGIWKWRAQSFLNTQNFEVFDAFIGKSVQYLASNVKKERLVVDASDEFLLGDVNINVQYFDENYVFDTNETIVCKLIDQKTKREYNFDFLYKNNSYELELSHLPYGDYQYTIATKNKKLVKKGSFEILNFNIEAQFINPDVTKLQQLATNSSAKLHYISNYKKLFSELKNNEEYKTIQRATLSQLPVIHWKYLLGILLLLLTIEWFLRKFNGLI